ncbi:TrbC/VirB2 family protein [Paenibacillus larvae]
MENVISTIHNLTNTLKPITPAVAGLVLVIIGLMYMFAKNQQLKESCTGWMMNVLIGFGIVYLAIAIINWFSSGVVGFG